METVSAVTLNLFDMSINITIFTLKHSPVQLVEPKIYTQVYYLCVNRSSLRIPIKRYAELKRYMFKTIKYVT